MPRKSRKNIYSKFLHIMVQGLNKEYIFNNEKEIREYLKLLFEGTNEFNVEIVAYCIMNNHAHILSFTEDIIEISRFMRKVNSKYGIYYNKRHNRCGYVFRNRYRAEEISSQTQLLSCINYIHNNPVKAEMCRYKHEYQYSSYNDYLYKIGIVNEELIQKCFFNYGIMYESILENNHETFKFIEFKENSIDAKERIIKNFLKKENITMQEIKNRKNILEDLILKLYLDHNFAQKEISEILEINRAKINRIIKNKI